MSLVISEFILGVAILLVSTQKLVKMAEVFSRAVKISPLIIGMTILAIGTSLPELVVSTVAAVGGDIGLGTGNIIGSNIVNVFLVLPVAILVGNLRIGTNKTQSNVLLLLVVNFLYFFLSYWGRSRLVAGTALLSGAVILTWEEYRWAVSGRKQEDRKFTRDSQKIRFQLRNFWLLPVFLAGIIAGGILVVRTIEELARATGYTTTILGLSLTAVATSLPELLATFFSEKDHNAKLAIGDIIGSNLYNLLLIGGVIAFFGPPTTIHILDWLIMLTSSIILVGIIRRYQGQVVPKWWGGILLLLFTAYLFILAH